MTDVSLTNHTDLTGDRRWRVVAQTLKHGNAPKAVSTSSEGYRNDDSFEHSKLLTLEALLLDNPPARPNSSLRGSTVRA